MCKEKNESDVILEESKAPESSLYEGFLSCTVGELEGHILSARSREERIFYRTLLNLRLRLDQEKIVGKSLL